MAIFQFLQRAVGCVPKECTVFGPSNETLVRAAAWCIRFANDTLRLLSLGSPISVSFVIGDQEEVTLPPALREALAEDGDFEAAWQAMTAGTRRAFAHRIGSAKGHDTIGRRVEEVRDWVMAGLTYSDVLKGSRGR